MTKRKMVQGLKLAINILALLLIYILAFASGYKFALMHH